MTEIYGVWDEARVVYVGQTTKGLHERMRKAKEYAHRNVDRYSLWLRYNEPAGVELLDVVLNERAARIAEAFWIHRLSPRLNMNTYSTTVGDIDALYREIGLLCGGEAPYG